MAVSSRRARPGALTACFALAPVSRTGCTSARPKLQHAHPWRSPVLARPHASTCTHTQHSCTYASPPEGTLLRPPTAQPVRGVTRGWVPAAAPPPPPQRTPPPAVVIVWSHRMVTGQRTKGNAESVWLCRWSSHAMHGHGQDFSRRKLPRQVSTYLIYLIYLYMRTCICISAYAQIMDHGRELTTPISPHPLAHPNPHTMNMDSCQDCSKDQKTAENCPVPIRPY